jgi:Zn finger protein HypA/HybF involved in hydrogenase expression
MPFENFFEFAERVKNRTIPIKAEDYDEETEIEIEKEPVCENCGRAVKPYEGRAYCADCASQTNTGEN